MALLPALSFGYRSPGAHVAIETAATLISALAAFILYGRFESTRSLAELILFGALVMLAVANLASAVTPAFTGRSADDIYVWLPAATNLLAAVTLACAAFAPDRPIEDVRRLRGRLTLVVAAAALVLVAVAFASPHLNPDLDPNTSPASIDRPSLMGSPGLLAVQLVLMSLLGAASLGFARRAETTGDELLAWIAIGALLGAFGRLNNFLFPSTYTNYVFTADLLKLSFYAVVLVGALRQIAAYRHAAARAAVREERMRIARDLHDSLAQDLAYISLEARRAEARDPGAAGIAKAADQALAASRGAIFELRGWDEPLPAAIARLAGLLAGRLGVRLHLDLDEHADASPEERNGLLRIMSEAISNAIRHGGASEIRVSLRREENLRLAISDNGTGFDPAALELEGADLNGISGVGITGMRERVERLGGTLALRSSSEGGVEVEVMIA